MLNRHLPAERQEQKKKMERKEEKKTKGGGKERSTGTMTSAATIVGLLTPHFYPLLSATSAGWVNRRKK